MTTDPAVTAAAEALNGPGSSYLIERGHLSMTDAEAAVAAARPIIEAEVRERIAADIVATATGPIGHESGLRYIRSDIAARIARGQT